MDVALYPKDCSEELAAALAIGGIRPINVDSLELATPEAVSAWSVLVVDLGDEPMRRLRHIAELVENSGLPVLAVAHAAQFALVEQATGIADFIAHPPDSAEVAVRIRRLADTSTGNDTILSFEDLVLNPLTYQASLTGEPLDLTYMEYELLRFFVEHRGRVWTREQLLSKVWGYDYFGGARTVDVHVRRLRAKLGEERAGWIVTVRSVGYRFG
ncbi:MAG: response regulator transcription factor [Acidimicrobiia bacterium]|nr:response regulator transcription factor [Acidimicrobiia bacterium]